MTKHSLIAACLLVLAFSAAPTIQAKSTAVSSESVEKPQQCLNELQPVENATAEATLEEQKKKTSPSWFEKLVKRHKLGSLHFQDIIELFH